MLLTRLAAAVAAAFWGIAFFGVIDLLTVFVEGQDFYDHYVVESGWGLLFLVLVAIPFAGLAVRPQQSMLRAQITLVALAVLFAALLGGERRQYLVAAGLLLSVWAVRRQLPKELPALGDRSLPLLLLAVVAAVPCLWYAVAVANDPGAAEDTWGLSHAPMQAALGLAVLLVAALVAYDDGPGALLSAVTVAFAAVWIGVESVVYPDLVGSVGIVGGVLTALWGAAFLGVFLLVRRQASATRSA